MLPLPLLYAALVLLRSSLCLLTVQTHKQYSAVAAATAAYITVFAEGNMNLIIHSSD